MSVGVPNPLVDRATRRGAERVVERLLAALIVGGQPPVRGTPEVASRAGVKLLMALDNRVFGTLEWPTLPSVVRRFSLAAEPRPAPAVAALWESRILLCRMVIRDRSRQLTLLEGEVYRARARFPEHQIDVLVLGSGDPGSLPPSSDRTRYGTLTLDQLAQSIRKAWPVDLETVREPALAHLFAEYLDRLTTLPRGTRSAARKPRSAAEHVERFARRAQAFQSWVLRGKSSGVAAVTEALRLLTGLYSAALRLPDPAAMPEEDAGHEFDPPTYPSLRRSLATRFPFQYYWEPLSVLDVEREPESATGDILDAIDEIYRDLVTGLAMHRKGMSQAAARHWTMRFRAHWGGEILSALRALHETATRASRTSTSGS